MMKLFLYLITSVTFLSNSALAEVVKSENSPKELSSSVIIIPRSDQIHVGNSLFDSNEKIILKKLGKELNEESITHSLSEARVIRFSTPREAEKFVKTAKRRYPKASVEVNEIIKPQEYDDRLLERQWGLKNTGEKQPVAFDDLTRLFTQGVVGEDIQIEGLPKENPNHLVTVAILDTGVDRNHPDLKDHILIKKEECEALAQYEDCIEKADSQEEELKACHLKWANTDRDGNSYPMDCSGWNVADRVNPETGIRGSSNTSDEKGHGTHIAGVIGAVKNSIGVRGVLESVRILPIKVMNLNPGSPVRPQSDDPPAPTDKDLKITTGLVDMVGRGILYAIHSKADVMNFSLAWPTQADSPFLRQMLGLALKKNILIVAAAGNDSTEARVMPCVYEGVICVGAHGPDGKETYFTNFGSAVDIAAPGIRILSTFPIGLRNRVFVEESGYEYKNGTSMAAPYVVGALARLLNAGFSPKEAKARLLLGSRVSELPKEFNQNKKYINGGNIDLNKSFALSPRPYISLKEKEFTRIAWNRKSDHVNLNVKFINQWKKANSAEIQFKVLNQPQRIQVSQVSQAQFQAWDEDEEKTIDLELSILDSRNLDTTVFIEVLIKTDQKWERKFILSAEIFVPITAQSSIATEVYPLLDYKVSPRAEIISIESHDGKSIQDYMLIERTSPTEIKLAVLSRGEDENQLSQEYRLVSEKTIQSHPGQTLVVQRVDINRDGYSDWVMVNQVVIASEEEASERNLYFQLLFFDRMLNPIAIKSSAPENEILHSTQVSIIPAGFQWMQMSTSLGRRLVPAWIEFGKLPESEMKPKTLWNPEPRNPVDFRLYYFDQGELRTMSVPELNLESGFKMGEKNGYKTKEIQSLKGTYFTHFLKPSRKDIESGTVQLLLAQVVEMDRSYLDSRNRIVDREKTETYRYVKATLKNKLLQNFIPIDFDENYSIFSDREPLKVELLTNQSEVSTLTGFVVDSTAGEKAVVMSESSPRNATMSSSLLESTSQTESVQGALAAFKDLNRTYVYSRTQYSLQFHDVLNQKKVKTSLRRYSYLPTYAPDLSFFPIRVRDLKTNQEIPGIYIPDGRGATSGMEVIVPVFDAHGVKELIRPASLHLESSRDCVDLENIGSHTHQAVYFCQDHFLRVPISY